jgi:alpha-tubulin suppressor-like RCC1 family protein
MPVEVTSLRGKVVLQVAAGAWHSAALVLIPPYLKGGWVYTWGTGLYGQLGHGNIERFRCDTSTCRLRPCHHGERLVTVILAEPR